MFALEAIRAKHGDCLLLHWGATDAAKDHKVALIDGGPDTVYEKYLKPTLKGLAEKMTRKVVPLDLVMVSHIDDDHINGILALADDIENGNDAPAEMKVLWHNSLEGLLNQKIETRTGEAKEVTASLGARPPTDPDKWYAEVLSSVPQGQLLHAFAKRMKIRMNDPYDGLVMRADEMADAKFAGLSLEIVGPAAKEVEQLRVRWKELRKEGITAAYSDRSPYNLSSIVVLANYGGRRALLTGDARGNLVIEGLASRKLLTDGKIHVNLLKLMHHGSQNNVTEGFFETVTADKYVVSGDHVKFPNPHEKAMNWLAEARKGDDYEVYCTYDMSYMRKIFGKRLKVPAKNANSILAQI
jgi:beta-lactamase superfamily II metal-dependent hydrolase